MDQAIYATAVGLVIWAMFIGGAAILAVCAIAIVIGLHRGWIRYERGEGFVDTRKRPDPHGRLARTIDRTEGLEERWTGGLSFEDALAKGRSEYREALDTLAET